MDSSLLDESGNLHPHVVLFFKQVTPGDEERVMSTLVQGIDPSQTWAREVFRR